MEPMRSKHEQWATYRQTIVPLAGLLSASLVLSNVTQIYLSVSFVQMLKVRYGWSRNWLMSQAVIPVLVQVLQSVAGSQGELLTAGAYATPGCNHLLLGITIVTWLGCLIVTLGEKNLSAFCLLCQVCAIMVSYPKPSTLISAGRLHSPCLGPKTAECLGD